jgi:hypothetical protein
MVASVKWSFEHSAESPADSHAVWCLGGSWECLLGARPEMPSRLAGSNVLEQFAEGAPAQPIEVAD